MNPYVKNLNRIEFLITLACTGRCKHCSEGEHTAGGEYIDGDAAAQVVYELCGTFNIESLMTFGGEPLLHPDEVCKIHTAAREMNIPKRQLITNGFFSKDEKRIKETAEKLAESGVNNILLSVDAFHQETIPLEPVRAFAEAVKATGIPLRTQPAWLVDKEDKNPYNQKTLEILNTFEQMDIMQAGGNLIFPSGNALKYLGEYFEPGKEYINPYDENPEDIRAICISPDGSVLGSNMYQSNILDILEHYSPKKS